MRRLYKGIQMAEVVIHQNNSALKESKFMYLERLPRNLMIEFDYRKLKKESEYFLTEWTEFINIIEEYKQN
jgi:hypothetical protein